MTLKSRDGIELPGAYGNYIGRIERCQREQLKTLRLVVDICTRNGLRYYLIAGSALGAVRHKGFIPWDDDVDIAMPRPDYEKLADVIFAGGAALVAYEWKRTNDFCLSMMKVGRRERARVDHDDATMDVFPLDGVPASRFVRIVQYCFRVFATQVIHSRVGILRGVKGFVYRALGVWLPRNRWRIHAIMEWSIRHRGAWVSNSLVGLRFAPYREREFYRFEIYGVNGGVEAAFENEFFKVPHMTEEYLSQEFGDWRALPPVEKRLPHHVDDDPWFYSQLVKR